MLTRSLLGPCVSAHLVRSATHVLRTNTLTQTYHTQTNDSTQRLLHQEQKEKNAKKKRNESRPKPTEALALPGTLVEEHLGADHVPERRECRSQVGIGEVVRQVVDEQVRPRRT